MSTYKQGFVLVMEGGELITWVGYADNKEHAEGLAIAYASHKANESVWDMASLPINSQTKETT